MEEVDLIISGCLHGSRLVPNIKSFNFNGFSLDFLSTLRSTMNIQRRGFSSHAR